MVARQRGLILVLAVCTVALVVAGGWFYRAQEHLLRGQVEKELGAIAQLKAQDIARWRAERRAEAAEVAARPLLRRHLTALLADRARDPGDLLAEFDVLRSFENYRQILLVDSAGSVVLAAVGSPTRLDSLAAIATFEALRTRRPVLSDLHLEPTDESPHLAAVAPILGPGTVRGAILLVSGADDYLDPLIRRWPTPSRTAETLLVRRDGDGVLYLNDLRHRPGAAMHLRLPLDDPELPAALAIRSGSGIVRGRDYRGEPVLAALHAVPDSPWYLVSKIDRSEALAMWRVRSALILALVGGAVALLAALGAVVWQHGRRAHLQAQFVAERARRIAEERYAATLRSIGDGVIATDAQGRVVLLNAVAETLTGWPGAEAAGRPLEEVFRIVDEESRQPIDSPVSRVLQAGSVVGLTNHTLLMSRDGVERPINDSGAPIRDDAGAITGVVLVFRDQSEERAANAALRASEERFRTAVETAPDGIFVQTGGRFRYANAAAVKMFGAAAPADLVGTPVLDRFHPDIRAAVAARIARLNEQREAVPRLEETALRLDGTPVDLEVGAVPFTYEGQPGALVFARDVSERKQAEAERARLKDDLIQAQKMESVGRLAGGVAHDFNNMLGVIIGHTELAMMSAPDASGSRAHLEAIEAAARRSASLTRQLLAFARKQTVAPKVLDLNVTVPEMLKLLGRLVGEDIDVAWRPGANLWPVLIDPSQVDQILTNLAANARDAIRGTGTITIETGNVTFDDAYCERHAGFHPGRFVILAMSDDGEGMDRDTLDHMFEPFFTTKSLGRGTGLGLATVYGIVKQNGGFVNVYSEPGRGTTFKVYLPCADGRAVAALAREPASAPLGHGEVVLLVEDEPSLLDMSRDLLTGLGYTVLTAATPAEAIALVARYPGKIDLLFTDVVMPALNGRALAEQLRARKPDLRCLFMSGYTPNAIAHRGVLDEGVHFLQKPFSRFDLATKVRRALDAT